MVKTKNEKSSRIGTVREGLSPAVSNPEERICEVHSGVDSVNGVAGYGQHTLHASSGGVASMRVEPRSYFVSYCKRRSFFGLKYKEL